MKPPRVAFAQVAGLGAALVASLPALGALGGCITKTPGNGNASQAIVDVTWSLRHTSGATTTCPDGVTVAEVIAQPVDPTAGTPEGAPISTKFACGAATGAIALDPQSYILSVRFESDDGSAIYAQSLPSQQLDLTVEDLGINFDVYLDGGYIELGWELVNQSDGFVDCEQSGVSSIQLVLTPTGSGAGSGAPITTLPSPCADAAATTSAIPAGTYAVDVDALSSGGTVGKTSIAQVKVQAPNIVSGLGTVSITIDTP